VKELATQIVYVAPRQIDRGQRHLYPQTELASDARNLSDVLVDLQLNHPTTLHRELVAFIQAVFPEIDTLTVQTASQAGANALVGEPYVLYRGSAQRRVPLRACGSGVEQLIALAVAILISPPDRLFLIDEPQAYLHPHAERNLLDLLDAHPEHHYVIATHSHTLLGARPLAMRAC
jgi:predicted ATPase